MHTYVNLKNKLRGTVLTRREELLLDQESLQRVWILRKFMSDMTSQEAMEFLQDKMKGTRNNEEFLVSMNG